MSKISKNNIYIYMYDIDLLHSIWINCRVTFIKPGTKVVQYHFFVSNFLVQQAYILWWETMLKGFDGTVKGVIISVHANVGMCQICHAYNRCFSSPSRQTHVSLLIFSLWSLYAVFQYTHFLSFYIPFFTCIQLSGLCLKVWVAVLCGCSSQTAGMRA